MSNAVVCLSGNTIEHCATPRTASRGRVTPVDDECDADCDGIMFKRERETERKTNYANWQPLATDLRLLFVLFATHLIWPPGQPDRIAESSQLANVSLKADSNQLATIFP